MEVWSEWGRPLEGQRIPDWLPGGEVVYPLRGLAGSLHKCPFPEEGQAEAGRNDTRLGTVDSKEISVAMVAI